MRLIVALSLTFLATAPAQETGTQVWEKLVAPGMVYRMEYDPRIPMTMHGIRLSMASPAVRAVPALAGKTVFEDNDTKGRATVGQMMRENKAVGAINGDFFSLSGDPLGLMVRDGELLSTPLGKRAVFAWGPKKTAIGSASFSGLMTGGGSTVQIDGVNQSCGENEAILDTQSAGYALASAPSTMIVVRQGSGKWAPSTVMNGVISEILEDQTRLEVPRGTAVLVVRGKRAKAVEDLHVGTKVKFLMRTSGFDWEILDHAIGGGPMLLRNGKIVDDATEEGFREGFATTKNPRTAIGRTESGDMWFVVIEGRQESGSGATIEEEAKLMRRLGCIDAINLDGGGSTELALRGLIINKPSDGSERPIANGIVFMPKVGMPEPEPENAQLTVIGEAGPKHNAQARILNAAGKAVPNAEILWSSVGSAGWIDQGGHIHGVKNGRITVSAYVFGKRISSSVEIDGF